MLVCTLPHNGCSDGYLLLAFDVFRFHWVLMDVHILNLRSFVTNLLELLTTLDCSVSHFCWVDPDLVIGYIYLDITTDMLC